jgi:peptidoglycan/LPS O-acetylase OafA/YrhL
MSLKLRNLQALRGVACLMVVLYHVTEWEQKTGLHPTRLFLYPFAFFGYGGVDLFFVISGFIITWVHFDKLGRPSELAPYARKRFWRIYPSFWVCLAGTVGVLKGLLQLGIGMPDIGQALRWLTLMPQEHPINFLVHAWSLNYEVFFYCAFAAFFLLPRHCFVPLLTAWLAATVWLHFLARPQLPFAVAFALLPFTIEFLLGCFAAIALRHNVAAGARACAVLGATWILAGAWLNWMEWMRGADEIDHRFLLFGVPAALLVYGLTAREMADRWVLPHWLQSLGDASYSIYLWHLTMFFVVQWLLHSLPRRPLPHTPLPHLLWVTLMIAAPVGMGYLCYYGVERPLLNWTRRRRPAPAASRAPLRRAAA